MREGGREGGREGVSEGGREGGRKGGRGGQCEVRPAYDCSHSKMYHEKG